MAEEDFSKELVVGFCLWYQIDVGKAGECLCVDVVGLGFGEFVNLRLELLKKGLWIYDRNLKDGLMSYLMAIWYRKSIWDSRDLIDKRKSLIWGTKEDGK